MLVKIAKKLKKNNVAVDIVSFGHESDNEEKLSAFHGAVNSNDNSHLVTVPPGPVLSDVLIGSPIFQVGAAADIRRFHEQVLSCQRLRRRCSAASWVPSPAQVCIFST
jgi:hypothetical protein